MPRISQLNKISEREKRDIYRLLVPPTISERFEIEPETLKCPNGENLQVNLVCPEGAMEASLEVMSPEIEDSIFYIELSDSKDYVQLQWDFIKVNEPNSFRCCTNFDEEGNNRWLKWGARNIPEEIKAMEMGLAPGQTRKGMRVMKEINRCLDDFCKAAGLKSISLEALFYHTAIQFEKHGYRYFRGWKMMKRIDEQFRPGGKLYEKLDGSTPFRQPHFWKSIRGRSWAIHDGILEEIDDDAIDCWEPPIMYRMVGERHQTDTFPDGVY